MPCCKTISTLVQGSGSTGAKRRCGTVVGRDQQLAMCLNKLLNPSTLTPMSGGDHHTSQNQNRHEGVVEPLGLSTGRCWTEFHRFQTCSPRGHCSCVVLLRKPTTSCGLLSPMQLPSLPICTINGSGNLCVNCCTSIHHRMRRSGWIRNAARISVSAYWASWALPMLRARHGALADLFVRELEGELESPFLAAAAVSMRSLRGTMGFTPPFMAKFVHRCPPRNS